MSRMYIFEWHIGDIREVSMCDVLRIVCWVRHFHLLTCTEKCAILELMRFFNGQHHSVNSFIQNEIDAFQNKLKIETFRNGNEYVDCNLRTKNREQ